MKKVLIGVGIGCGVLILVGMGALFAGGLWVKNKFGGSIEAAQKLQTQEQELTELNRSHPFQPPADGEVLALDPKRLETYFAVRESALPVFKTFEQKSDEFEKQHGGEDGQQNPSLGAAMEAANLMMGLVTEVRTAYISALKQHGMSPAEFQSITGTVYASVMAEGMDQMREAAAQGRVALEKQLEEMDKRLEDESLSDAERTQLEEAQGQLQAAIDSMAQGTEDAPGGLSEASKKTAAANMALLKKYEDRVQVMANAAFDGFVLGGAGSDSPGSNVQDLE
ncbi:hypothetical protein [Pyxidicoccus xibeiensis]|uniref:hypothetical protein n=1 Tax=Pyxidicoccus xibeiensis TaxID=2906759 RepID=UPI0020A7758A|nr:hypothetical protein [Pyxidicoccus xibeiensis]MCP3136294.1 hypothetical protein [Pyxidicoccus xibeiensis]